MFWAIIFHLPLHAFAEEAFTKSERDSIGSFINSLVDEGFSGAVAVGSSQGLLFEGFYGQTYNEPPKPIDKTTLFWTASIGKSITAIAIMKLSEEGKLGIDDPLSKFFPELPAENANITIGQLLSHTSGFPPGSYTPENSKNFEKAIKKILNANLVSIPGAEFNYSNDGFFLLAHIVDLVSGTSFENYVQKQIFDPGNMTYSRFWQNLDLGLGTSFAGFPVDIGAVFLEKKWALRGYNGISTNAGDLYLLAKALQNGNILNFHSLNLLWARHFELRTLDVGYGWFLSKPETGSLEISARGSDDFGGNAIVSFFPDHDLIISVTTNSGPIEYENSSELYRWKIKTYIAKTLGILE